MLGRKLTRKICAEAPRVRSEDCRSRGESVMGSHLSLIGLGLVALFATSFIKIAAIAAIGWGAWKAYNDWGAQ